jgi:hypothetical protein
VPARGEVRKEVRHDRVRGQEQSATSSLARHAHHESCLELFHHHHPL